MENFQKPPSGLFIAVRRHMYFNRILGFLGRNRLAAHSQPPGDARDYTKFWIFYELPGGDE